MMIRRLLAALVFVLTPLTIAAAQNADYDKVVTLLSTHTTNLGQPIAYPAEGPAKVTSLIVTLPPGEETGWHSHPVVVYGYMLSGAVTVDYGATGTRVYRSGEAFIEAIDTWHNGTSTGAEPARILVVFVGADHLENVIRREATTP